MLLGLLVTSLFPSPTLRGGVNDVETSPSPAAIADDGKRWWEAARPRGDGGRKLQSRPAKDACMQENYKYYKGANNAISCSAQNIKFQSLAGIDVHDRLAMRCNCGGAAGSCSGGTNCAACDASNPSAVSCAVDGKILKNGTYLGACLGNDDNVNVSLAFNIGVSNSGDDLGLYLATDGGSVLSTTSHCYVAPLTAGVYDSGKVNITYTDSDQCLDIKGSGTLTNYYFSPIVMKCADLGGNSYLDFDVGVSWENTANCTFLWDGISNPPYPAQGSKCWTATGDAGSGRIELPIYVPPYPTPSARPSKIFIRRISLIRWQQHRY